MYNRLVAILLILAVCIPFIAPLQVVAASQWVNVEINPAQVPGDLTDFIVYVDLSDLPSDFWDTTNCTDIRVFKSDGSTELAREIVSCTDSGSSGTGELWYKYSGTTSGTATTTAQIHYDGSSSDYAVTDTYGRNAVWSDYEYVLHLESDATDSTGNHTMTATNVTYSSSGAAFGSNGAVFNGTSARIVTPSISYITAGYTLQAWYYRNNTSGVQSIFSKDNGTTRVSTSYLNNGNTTKDWFMWNSSGGIVANASHTMTTATWNKLSSIYSGGTGGYVRNILNGSQVHNTNTTSSPRTNSFPTWYGADQFGGGRWWLNGYIDEIRERHSAISNDQEEAEYNNQSSPSTFYWVSAEQTAGGGGGGGATQFIIWFIAYKPEVTDFALV